MLSRVAEQLFWIGRYIERAENVARLVDAARRMTALPVWSAHETSNEWASVLIAAGAHEPFGESLGSVDAAAAIERLIFAPSNPSSVAVCLQTARENGRAIRFALTQEVWEALNTAWSEMRNLSQADSSGSGLSDLVDWVKQKSAVLRGAIHGTMLRGDSYNFLESGMSVERTDSMARLLDVKYHVLLDSVADVGTGADHYQWLSLLQAAGAQRAYFAVTKSDISARGVAEFLILNGRFPRSILYNLRRTDRIVQNLQDFYGRTNPCHDEIIKLTNEFEALQISGIMNYGLHEFLTDVIERNYEIANIMGHAYGFGPNMEMSSIPDDRSEQ